MLAQPPPRKPHQRAYTYARTGHTVQHILCGWTRHIDRIRQKTHAYCRRPRKGWNLVVPPTKHNEIILLLNIMVGGLGQKPYLLSRLLKCAQTPPILAAGFAAQRSTTAVSRATCRSATTTIACAVLRLCRRAVVAGGGGEDDISAVSKHVAVATAAQVRA